MAPTRVTALTALVVVLLSGCGSHSNKAGGAAGGKPIVLTLANPLGNSEELDSLVRDVNRLSRGALQIDVQNNWRRGDASAEEGLIADVRAGKAPLGVVGTRAWDNVGVTSLQALVAPFLVDSYGVEERVLRSHVPSEMLLGLRPLQLVGLGVLPGPLRRPLGIAHPLLGPGDYAGLRIGTSESRVASATLRMLGAEPVRLAVHAAINGLGGVEQQIDSIAGNQYDRIGKSLTANVVLWPRPLTVFANQRAFARLPAKARRILRAAMAEDVSDEAKAVVQAERDSTAVLCRRGVRLVSATQVDLRALRRSVRAIYAELQQDPQTRRYLNQIEAMRNGAPAPPVQCGRTPTPATNAKPFQGVWRFTTTPEDLRAANADVSEIIAENYGRWTVVVDNGRFVIVQQNARACTWAYGRLTVDGSKLEFSVVNGGGIAPTGATDKPGELWSYNWSSYRDTVTLRRVAGAISPTPLIAKPWQHVSTQPSTAHFAQRCPPPARALVG